MTKPKSRRGPLCPAAPDLLPRLKKIGMFDPKTSELVKMHHCARNLFVIDLPLQAIRDSSFIVRLAFDESFIKALAVSIRTVGLVEPIIVRPLLDEPGYYETIAGHYRRRAVALLGYPTIPALVRTFSAKEAAVAAVVTNDARMT